MLHRLAAALLALPLLFAASCSDASGGEVGPDEVGSARTVSGGEPIGPAGEGIEGVVAFRVDSNDHTEQDLAYDPSPPAGGDHYPVPATCGFYETDPPPDEMLVHDLEHGAVWIAYDPGLDEVQRSALASLVAQQGKVTATPREDLPSPLVVSAWARQLQLDRVDDPRLAQFIETYRNGANAPEGSGVCQGVGDPAVASPSA